MAFSNQQSYIAAISARFVQLQHGDIDKRVSLSTDIVSHVMLVNFSRFWAKTNLFSLLILHLLIPSFPIGEVGKTTLPT